MTKKRKDPSRGGSGSKKIAKKRRLAGSAKDAKALSGEKVYPAEWTVSRTGGLVVFEQTPKGKVERILGQIDSVKGVGKATRGPGKGKPVVQFQIGPKNFDLQRGMLVRKSFSLPYVQTVENDPQSHPCVIVAGTFHIDIWIFFSWGSDRHF